MKTLFLLRHATSDPALAGQPDHDRPLSATGLEEATAIGSELAERYSDELPSLLLCSTALRTVETLNCVRSQLSLPSEVETHTSGELYLATGDELLRSIAESSDSAERLLVVAHNPGVAALARSMVEKGDKSDVERLATYFPPASLVALRFRSQRWSSVVPGRGELLSFTTASDLRG